MGTASATPVIWITGLSGSGKSTVALRVVNKLRAGGGHALLIDGDEFRALHDNDLSHDREDRLRNAMRISRFAGFVAAQGIPVVVATMSLFREVHDWNRKEIPGYFEVLLSASVEFLATRDAKGLYGQAAAGDRAHVVGVDLELDFDLPGNPDLTIDAELEIDPDRLAHTILDAAGLRLK